ncbi:MAG TPA: hypothetical protein VNA68_02235 [Candidatus Dormibacteraeota bacterium]|nr:hypothetical protein [Candidatus Dormibacteraeota bacterium]
MKISKRNILIIAALAMAFGIIQIAAGKSYVNQQAAKIVAKDAAGQDVGADLVALQLYTNAHMLSGTQIFLKDSYNRAVEAAKATAQPSSSSQLYGEAQRACAVHKDSIAQAKCVSDYINSRARPGANPQPAVMPDQAAYTKVLTSPIWTPDLAGLSILAAVVVLAIGIYRARA